MTRSRDQRARCIPAFDASNIDDRTQAIAHFADTVRDPTASPEAVGARGNSLGHSIDGMVVLRVTLALNVYKPRGVTSYCYRKQQEQRSEPRR